ncbi:hypothetical protein COU14_00635, partial [Candidatus Kaiserbacteria bacterium CG10_big_fil_rev_8_21_14_0_10_44_10]
AFEGSGGRLIGGGVGEDRGYSPDVAKAIDEEVSKLISKGMETAKEILSQNRKALDAISMRLLEVETLEREEYEAILKAEGVEIKDFYRDQRLEEERIGDPTRAIEFDADHMKGKEV